MVRQQAQRSTWAHQASGLHCSSAVSRPCVVKSLTMSLKGWSPKVRGRERIVRIRHAHVRPCPLAIARCVRSARSSPPRAGPGRLFDTGFGWPAALFDPGATSRVPGLLLRLEPSGERVALAVLDDVEGVATDLFEQLATTTTAGARCYAYTWSGLTTDLVEISSWELEGREAPGRLVLEAALSPKGCMRAKAERTPRRVWSGR